MYTRGYHPQSNALGAKCMGQVAEIPTHEFHETCHSVTYYFMIKDSKTMLWHHNARVNSHQRWKQTRFRVCFHLWCELTSTMNGMEWQVSWNSWVDQGGAENTWFEGLVLQFLNRIIQGVQVTSLECHVWLKKVKQLSVSLNWCFVYPS